MPTAFGDWISSENVKLMLGQIAFFLALTLYAARKWRRGKAPSFPARTIPAIRPVESDAAPETAQQDREAENLAIKIEACLPYIEGANIGQTERVNLRETIRRQLNRLSRAPGAEAESDDARDFSAQAMQALRQCRIPDAAGFLEQAAALATGSQAAWAWIDAGNVAMLTDAEKALNCYLEAVGRDADNVDAWSQLGQAYLLLGHPDETQKALENVLQLSASRDREAFALACGNMGILLADRGDFTRAGEHYRNALAILEDLGKDEEAAAACKNLGNLYYTRKDGKKALEYFQKALELYARAGRRAAMADMCEDLGYVCRESRDLAGAIVYYQHAMALHTELDHPARISEDAACLAGVYCRMEALDRAQALYLQALEIQQSLGNRPGMAQTLGNLGVIYQYLCEYDKAEAHFRQALEIHEALDMKREAAWDYYNMGLLDNAAGQMAAACENWGKALALFKTAGEKSGMEAAAHLLKRHCKGR